MLCVSIDLAYAMTLLFRANLLQYCTWNAILQPAYGRHAQSCNLCVTQPQRIGTDIG